MRYAWLLALMFLVVACQQPAGPDRPGLPSLGEPPTIQALPEEDVEETPPALPDRETAAEANPGLDSMFGTRKSGDAAITANDVICLLDERELIFRFTNTDTKRWQLNNDVPLQGTADLVGAYVMVNNYQVNDKAHYLDGERLFGPDLLFSDNCNGVAEVAPGDTVVCHLTNVPLRPKGRAGGVNEIHINVPGSAEDPRVEFTC